MPRINLRILIITASLFTVSTSGAAELAVTGGLEMFLETFPDEVEIYFQTKTEEGVGFFTLTTPAGEITNTGIIGRSATGNSGLLVHEGPGEDGPEDIFVRPPDGGEVITFGGPLRDLHPCVFTGGLVAFTTEIEEVVFDLALWTESTGMMRLDLDCGDETEPAIFYAAPADPLDHPAVVVFQGRDDDDFQLYYAVLGPGGEVVRAEQLFEFPGRALCPDILVPRRSGEPEDGDTARLAFHGLVEGAKRDVYLCELTFHGDLGGNLEEIRLTVGEPERLTESPAEDKYPELYTDSSGALWCLFASYRDGDYDIYALNTDMLELYQLTDLPGTQTAPLVMRNK